MKRKSIEILRLKRLLIPIMLGLALSACGGEDSGGGSSGGGSNSVSGGDDSATNVLDSQALKVALAEAAKAYDTQLAAIAPSLPPAPETQVAKATVAGVDINSNGVRDDIERALAQGVAMIPSATASDYLKLLDVVKYLQPSETEKTIDHKIYYCLYTGLPQKIQEKISSNLLRSMVIDTKDRAKIFVRQSINTSGNLGAEICG